jgi:hypothetical protein
MQNRTPVPRGERAPLPDFAPVPRKHRHDGWTPDRQRAFIHALADTGCVTTACRMVNMSSEGAYYLRRQPGAEGFRRAWEAALDFGVARLRDIAFERAIEGQLVPVFVAGKLMGFRRKKNDRLLMFCLRHYGQDANGRRVTVNYFSSRASAGAAAQAPPRNAEGDHAQHEGGGAEPRALASAEARTATIRTTISNPDRSAASIGNRDDDLAAAINGFEGVALDDDAQAEILRVLEACAERRRDADPDRYEAAGDRLAVQEDDPECGFIRLDPGRGIHWAGELESGVDCQEFVPFTPDELPWKSLGEPVPEWFEQYARDQRAKCEAIGEQGEESILPGQPAPECDEGDRTDGAAARAGEPPSAPVRPERVEGPSAEPDPDDPRLDWRNWESGSYAPPKDPPPNGEGDRAKPGGGGLEPIDPDPPETRELPVSPRTGKPLKRYRKRTPKPVPS